MPEFKTAEKRTESKDLWESDGRLLVCGALGSPGAGSGCGKAAGFCGQDQEPLIQAQGADPYKHLVGVEIAEGVFFSVPIHVMVEESRVGKEKKKCGFKVVGIYMVEVILQCGECNS